MPLDLAVAEDLGRSTRHDESRVLGRSGGYRSTPARALRDGHAVGPEAVPADFQDPFADGVRRDRVVALELTLAALAAAPLDVRLARCRAQRSSPAPTRTPRSSSPGFASATADRSPRSTAGCAPSSGHCGRTWADRLPPVSAAGTPDTGSAESSRNSSEEPDEQQRGGGYLRTNRPCIPVAALTSRRNLGTTTRSSSDRRATLATTAMPAQAKADSHAPAPTLRAASSRAPRRIR